MADVTEQKPAEQPAGQPDIGAMSPAEIRSRAIELWGVASLLAGMSPVMRAAWKTLTPAQIRQLVMRRDVTLEE